MQVGDLVRYDPIIFEKPTLSEKHAHPFGWLKDEYEGNEQDWLGIIITVDKLMWGRRGGTGYEVLWSHGHKEKVYAFEIKKVVDTPSQA